jgi:hypothetical protein
MNTASPRSAEIPGTVVLKTEWKTLATLRAGRLRRMAASGKVNLHFTSSSTLSTLLNAPKSRGKVSVRLDLPNSPAVRGFVPR